MRQLLTLGAGLGTAVLQFPQHARAYFIVGFSCEVSSSLGGGRPRLSVNIGQAVVGQAMHVDALTVVGTGVLTFAVGLPTTTVGENVIAPLPSPGLWVPEGARVFFNLADVNATYQDAFAVIDESPAAFVGVAAARAASAGASDGA